MLRASRERPLPRVRTAPSVWLTQEVKRTAVDLCAGDVDAERAVKLWFLLSLPSPAGHPANDRVGDSARVGGSSAGVSLPGRLLTLLRRLLRVLAMRCREPMTDAIEGALATGGCDVVGSRRQPMRTGGDACNSFTSVAPRLSRMEGNLPSMLARRGCKSYDCSLMGCCLST